MVYDDILTDICDTLSETGLVCKREYSGEQIITSESFCIVGIKDMKLSGTGQNADGKKCMFSFCTVRIRYYQTGMVNADIYKNIENNITKPLLNGTMPLKSIEITNIEYDSNIRRIACEMQVVLSGYVEVDDSEVTE